MMPDLKPYVQTPDQFYMSWMKFNADVVRLSFNATYQLTQDVANAWTTAFSPSK